MIPDIKPKCETLRKILVKKSIIEYEDRDFSQAEALEILKLTVFLGDVPRLKDGGQVLGDTLLSRPDSNKDLRAAG